jgi:hypothetical protein
MDLEKPGSKYALAVCSYIGRQYANRGIKLYREVPVGRSIIGKNRRIDILIFHEHTNRALAIECKYQNKSGTTDEKIPYALEDLRAMRMPACLVYGGDGFSTGVLHMLRASGLAAHCPLSADGSPSDSRELDYILAREFGWWDVVVSNLKPFLPNS